MRQGIKFLYSIYHASPCLRIDWPLHLPRTVLPVDPNLTAVLARMLYSRGYTWWLYGDRFPHHRQGLFGYGLHPASLYSGFYFGILFLHPDLLSDFLARQDRFRVFPAEHLFVPHYR